MMNDMSVATIIDTFTRVGATLYGGEAITQLEHALQCAQFAELAGSDDTAIAAALLHDFGHLQHELGGDALAGGLDDRHERRGWYWLRDRFPARVSEPVRLHVDAKRYLCATEADYLAQLSPVSRRSLEIQGGVFAPEEAAAFIAQPYAERAVQLRRWDDLAKVPQLPTPPLSHYLPAIARLVI